MLLPAGFGHFQSSHILKILGKTRKKIGKKNPNSGELRLGLSFGNSPGSFPGNSPAVPVGQEPFPNPLEMAWKKQNSQKFPIFHLQSGSDRSEIHQSRETSGKSPPGILTLGALSLIPLPEFPNSHWKLELSPCNPGCTLGAMYRAFYHLYIKLFNRFFFFSFFSGAFPSFFSGAEPERRS